MVFKLRDSNVSEPTLVQPQCMPWPNVGKSNWPMSFCPLAQNWLTGGKNLSWPNVGSLIAKNCWPNIWVSVALFVVATTFNKCWPNVSISGRFHVGSQGVIVLFPMK